MKKTMLTTIALSAMLLLASFQFGCYQEGDTITEPPPPPVEVPNCSALFAWVQTPGTLNVSFQNQTSPPECSEHQWSFGDGTGSSREANPTHAYPQPGQYIARLTSCPGPDFTAPECGDVSQTVLVAEVEAEANRTVKRKKGGPTGPGG